MTTYELDAVGNEGLISYYAVLKLLRMNNVF